MTISRDSTLEYERGARVAASLAGEYDGCSTHAYRLEDCVLGKMNLLHDRKRPRRNPKRSRVTRLSPGFKVGFAQALATLVVVPGIHPSWFRILCAREKITLALLRTMGMPAGIISALRGVGVK